MTDGPAPLEQGVEHAGALEGKIRGDQGVEASLLEEGGCLAAPQLLLPEVALVVPDPEKDRPGAAP